MKSKEELNALKNEVEALSKKLAELSEDELAQVSGGLVPIPSLFGFIGDKRPDIQIVADAAPPAADIIDELRS